MKKIGRRSITLERSALTLTVRKSLEARGEALKICPVCGTGLLLYRESALESTVHPFALNQAIAVGAVHIGRLRK